MRRAKTISWRLRRRARAGLHGRAVELDHRPHHLLSRASSAIWRSGRALPAARRPIRLRRAGRDVERELRQAAAAEAAPVARRAPADVVCLQETKLADAAFDELLGEELAAREYAVARHGQGSGTGSRSSPGPGSTTSSSASPGPRASRTPRRAPSRRPATGSACTASTCRTGASPAPSLPLQARVAGGAARVRPPAQARDGVRRHEHRARGHRRLRPRAYVGQTHVTVPERQALRSCSRWGSATSCASAGRPSACSPTGTTAGMFHQDLGMRIDLVLAGEAVADRVRAAWVDRHARKGSGPSDHAPVSSTSTRRQTATSDRSCRPPLRLCCGGARRSCPSRVSARSRAPGVLRLVGTTARSAG